MRQFPCALFENVDLGLDALDGIMLAGFRPVAVGIVAEDHGDAPSADRRDGQMGRDVPEDGFKRGNNRVSTRRFVRA